MWSNKKFILSLIKFMKTKGEDLKELDDMIDPQLKKDKQITEEMITNE